MFDSVDTMASIFISGHSIIVVLVQYPVSQLCQWCVARHYQVPQKNEKALKCKPSAAMKLECNGHVLCSRVNYFKNFII